MWLGELLDPGDEGLHGFAKEAVAKDFAGSVVTVTWLNEVRSAATGFADANGSGLDHLL